MRVETRKNQILDGAKKLMACNGYHQTHMDDILREVKIGKGTFYLYFKNKEDLFISILERFLHEWEKFVLAATKDPDWKDLKIYFQTLISRSLHFFKQNEDLCNIYLRIGPGTSNIFEPYIERFEQKMLNYVINELQRGIAANVFRKDFDIEVIANIIVGAHLRLAYFYFLVKKKKRRKPDIDQMSDALFSLINKGLSS